LFFESSDALLKEEGKMVRKDKASKKRPENSNSKTIEVGKVLFLRCKKTLPIAVIDEEIQRRFPSLLVSPTLTVQKDQREQLIDSEPKMQHDK
jgi:hypothetical protein